jgi:voltage-gated potassium channel
MTKYYDWAVTHRHPIFLVGLLLFFILPEIFEMAFFIRIPPQLIITILVVSSMLLIRTSARFRIVPYIFVTALVAFIVIWNNFGGSPEIEKAAYIFLFIYFSSISYYLYRDLMNSETITASVIIGAFAGYFMIGVIYFFIFAFLDLAYPDTCSVDMTASDGIDNMFYFSFITLTTIGYGDFSPTSGLGQKIAVLEGLIGQFYMAIIMAIMVGKFLTRNPKT